MVQLIFVTFIDDFSNFTVVYLVKRKFDVSDCLKDYLKMNRAMFNTLVSKFRCDNSGENIVKEFQQYCRNKGIILDYVVAYTPQQNGKAERMNRTLVERARAVLADSGVDKNLG